MITPYAERMSAPPSPCHCLRHFAAFTRQQTGAFQLSRRHVCFGYFAVQDSCRAMATAFMIRLMLLRYVVARRHAEARPRRHATPLLIACCCRHESLRHISRLFGFRDSHARCEKDTRFVDGFATLLDMRAHCANLPCQHTTIDRMYRRRMSFGIPPSREGYYCSPPPAFTRHGQIAIKTKIEQTSRHRLRGHHRRLLSHPPRRSQSPRKTATQKSPGQRGRRGDGQEK